MKQPVNIGLNYLKTLKSGPEDTNEENVFCEVNLILRESTFELNKKKQIVSKEVYSEVEFYLDVNSAKSFLNMFSTIYKTLVELESIEQNKKS